MLRRSVDYFSDGKNRDEVVDIMAKYAGGDRATADKIYSFYIDKQIIAAKAAISPDGIQAVIDSLVASGELKTLMKAADVIDGGYLEEAGR